MSFKVPYETVRRRWSSPNDHFFVIKHFDQPDFDEAGWTLAVGGLVVTFLADARRPRGAVAPGGTFTMECPGNTGLPFFYGGIGNDTRTGTSLAVVVAEAGAECE